MNIYKFEDERGLASVINNHSIANVPVDVITPKYVTPDLKIEQKEIASAKEFFNHPEDKEFEKFFLPKGSMLVHAVLVSTVWNKNDDVFIPEETLKAAYTPIFKPANMEHLGREAAGENTTIGVMVNAMITDDHYEQIFIDPSDLPEFFNIIVGIHVWEAYWPTIAGNIKESIDNNEMFVSMECLFHDFGYALQEEGSDEIQLLPRNDITSWLSSHLRALGGTGEVEIDDKKYRVGRYLKDFVFSGVGFVSTPANPGSIVFEDFLSTASFTNIPSEEVSAWSQSKEKVELDNENRVLIISTEGVSLWTL